MLTLTCFVSIRQDDDEQEEESHGREEGESDDEASPPPAGNTEGEGLRLSKTELRDARGW